MDEPSLLDTQKDSSSSSDSDSTDDGDTKCDSSSENLKKKKIKIINFDSKSPKKKVLIEPMESEDGTSLPLSTHVAEER